MCWVPVETDRSSFDSRVVSLKSISCSYLGAWYFLCPEHFFTVFTRFTLSFYSGLCSNAIPSERFSLIILHKITSYPIPSHPIFLYPVSSAYFLYSTFQYLKSYTCLLVNCLTLQCKRHDSQNFIYSTQNLQHIERRSVENCWMKSVFKK